MNVSLRKATREDEPFLFKLYVSMRAEEFSAVPWSEEQLEAFLRTQFTMQQRTYDAKYPEAEHKIILCDGTDAGAVKFNSTPEDIHLVDLILLPEYRNQGAGSTLLKQFQREAEHTGRTISLRVVKTNPAIRLYKRVGFSVLDEEAAYLFMKWSAGG